ncbi:MAG: PAS domain S-box protein [Magnetococcus sp. YQC-5]
MKDVTASRENDAVIQDYAERLHLALKAAKGGSWSRDLKTGKMIWDEGMERLFGLQSGTFSGTTAEWENKVHPEDVFTVTQAIIQAVKRREDLCLEYRIQNSQGNGWIVVNTFGHVVTNDHGTPIRLVGICLDVTERVEGAKRFRTLFDHARDGILVVNLRTHRLVMANPMIGKQLGYSPEELLAMGVDDIHPVAALPRIYQELDLAGKGETELHQNIPMLRKDGQVFLADIAVSSMILDGDPCVFGFFRDVSLRELREHQTKSRVERYQAMLELSKWVSDDVSQLANFVLEKLVSLTQSRLGLLCFMSLDESEMTIYPWPQNAMPGCVLDGCANLFTIQNAGICGDVVRQRQTLLMNQIDSTSGEQIVLPYHPSVTRMITHPVIDGDKMVVVAVVANKETHYHEEDVEHISLLCLALRRTIKQHQLEKIRIDNEERFRALVESATDAIISINQNGEIVFWNHWAERIFQFSCMEATGQSIALIIPARYAQKHLEGFHQALQTGHLRSKPGQIFSVFGLRKDGQEIPLEMTLATWKMSNLTYYTAILRDVSAKKQLENQLRQSQKMEAIGLLAGGIAHDFNNILAIILGNIDLATMNINEGMQAQAHADMRDAVNRGRDLVNQLMTFGRKTPSRMEALSPALIIKEVLKGMRSTLPASIQLIETIHDDQLKIFIDPTHLHQILINLCTNAGHAMSDQGGVLEISQMKVRLDSQNAAWLDVVAGEYCRISVSDTGPGIAHELQNRIFEPFFTTKPESKGCGLGLSVVHGAIKNSSGAIQLESEPGKGATFTVFIPIIKSATETQETDAAGGVVYKKYNGRILFVDDEPALVDVGIKLLQALGYTVTGATDSSKALEIFLEQPDAFEAVITDQIMNGLTGYELATHVHRVRPELPIFLCTGFSESMTEEKAAELGLAGFFYKPVSMAELAKHLKDVLGY